MSYVKTFVSWFNTKPFDDTQIEDGEYVYEMTMYSDVDPYPTSTDCDNIEYYVWPKLDPNSDEFKYPDYIFGIDLYKDKLVIYGSSYDASYTVLTDTFIEVTEEEAFQYSLLHDVKYITTEELLMLINISKKLSERLI